MKFTETPLAGAWVIELDEIGDDRGFFARSFCQHEFAEHGLTRFYFQAIFAPGDLDSLMRGLELT